MNGFAWALAQLQANHAVKRSGWPSGQSVKLFQPDDTSQMTTQFIFMSQAGGVAFPWSPENSDLLLTDWTTA